MYPVPFTGEWVSKQASEAGPPRPPIDLYTGFRCSFGNLIGTLGSLKSRQAHLDYFKSYHSLNESIQEEWLLVTKTVRRFHT